MPTVEEVAQALKDTYRTWWDDYTIPAQSIVNSIKSGKYTTVDHLFQYIWNVFPGGGTAEIAANHLNTKLNLNLKD